MYRPIILALTLTMTIEALPYCGDIPPCRMWCPFGYERDEYGCAMCRCLDPEPAPMPDEPVLCEAPVCLFFQPACKVYLKNDQGCDTCECEVPLFGRRESEERVQPGPTPQCNPTPCLFYLPACVIYKKDQNGCDTCECDVAIRDIVSLTQRRANSELKDFEP